MLASLLVQTSPLYSVLMRNFRVVDERTLKFAFSQTNTPWKSQQLKATASKEGAGPDVL